MTMVVIRIEGRQEDLAAAGTEAGQARPGSGLEAT
jgi:hypothetical protein